MTHRFLYRLQIIGIAVVLLLAQPANLRAQDDEETGDSDTTGIAVAPVLEEQHAAYQEKVYEADPASFRQVPDSAINKLKRQKDFAYANDPAYWVQEPQEEEKNGFLDSLFGFLSRDGVRTVLFILLIGFFLFIVYRVLVVNNLYLFSRRSTKKVAIDEGEGDIEDENLDERIIAAIDRKEHRLAVRFMYLKSLRLLKDRQWIRFHAQTTNYEYVTQMSGHKMANEFSFLTRIYDYVWYGEFPLNEEQFKLVHNNFQNFYTAVK